MKTMFTNKTSWFSIKTVIPSRNTTFEEKKHRCTEYHSYKALTKYSKYKKNDSYVS